MKSLIFALLASLLWGTAPVLFKLGLKGDVPPVTALVFHNLSALLIALAFVGIAGFRLDYPLKDLLLIAL
ncbi:MAG: hypothetical protein RMK21_05760, partial [Aquificaceae bacterium]|nr:hypothetical protein [Aquificaceae bacterium]